MSVESKQHRQGRKARSEGKRMDLCPYKRPDLRDDWIAGWRQRDVEIAKADSERERVRWEGHRSGWRDTTPEQHYLRGNAPQLYIHGDISDPSWWFVSVHQWKIEHVKLAQKGELSDDELRALAVRRVREIVTERLGEITRIADERGYLLPSGDS